MKQACMYKRCPNKRYAPPTKVASEKTPQIPSDSIFEGDHSDECYICYDGGQLVCCDYCPKGNDVSICQFIHSDLFLTIHIISETSTLLLPQSFSSEMSHSSSE
jgi:hypothetical protein